MSADPCMDAALKYVRPSILRRAWRWYKRITGYEKAILQRRTGLRIQSTVLPTSQARPFKRKDDFLNGII